MEKNSKSGKSAVPGDSFTGNAVGLSEMPFFREKALKTLSKAYSQEEDKINRGYKWITLGKSRVLVHPDNAAKYAKGLFKPLKP